MADNSFQVNSVALPFTFSNNADFIQMTGITQPSFSVFEIGVARTGTVGANITFTQQNAGNGQINLNCDALNVLTFFSLNSTSLSFGSLFATQTALGINNGTPAYALDVTGDINLTGTLRVNGTAFSGGTSYPDITDTGGKVGIGTGSPSQKLDVAGWIKTSNGIQIGNTQVLSLTGGGNLNFFTGNAQVDSTGNFYGVSLIIGGVQVVAAQAPAIPNSGNTTTDQILATLRYHGLIAT